MAARGLLMENVNNASIVRLRVSAQNTFLVYVIESLLYGLREQQTFCNFTLVRAGKPEGESCAGSPLVDSIAATRGGC